MRFSVEDYVSQKQHDEFSNTIEAKFAEIKAEDKRQNERLKRTEDWQEKFSEMQVTLKQQGDNIEKLTNKVNELIEKPGKRWDSAVSYIITVILSLVVGYLFNLFI